MTGFLHINRAVAASVAVVGIALAGALPGVASAAGQTPAVAAAQVATARVTSSAYVPAKRTLEYGMHGSDVKALQQRLAQLAYYPGAADGQFGSGMLEAVWAFQEVQGLSADGVVGSRTEHALVSPRAPQSRYPRGGALRVEVNLGLRVLLLYRNNKLALVSHVSSGGGYYYCSDGSCSYAITPTGHFTTTRFMPGWVTVPLGQMYNPVFFIGTAYAIHGDTDVPLQPVSHGCVRVPMDIAAFFHTLVKSPGTPVYIYN
ncbi:MAG: L,D-transpeptidase family protein [Streptosporangiaceae bacterium]|jgi:peptidoglycan hydrolase-like protein with peptidoglycan-binding domain